MKRTHKQRKVFFSFSLVRSSSSRLLIIMSVEILTDTEIAQGDLCCVVYTRSILVGPGILQ